MSLASFATAIGFVAFMQTYSFGGLTLTVGVFLIGSVFTLWCRDTVSESCYLGLHTIVTNNGASLGFVVFMISETFFFAAFIWSFFYTGLHPSIHIGAIWPPMAISPMFPWTLPLLNTLTLLSSGATVTWAHDALLSSNSKQTFTGLVWTGLLGLIFSIVQAIEYHFSSFTLADSSFGAVVFTTLTLHAVHIWVGIVWLTLCLISLFHYRVNSDFHQMIEGALIFWHIVDAVWIVLFIFFYIWVS